jgi:chemotaxis protein MotB
MTSERDTNAKVRAELEADLSKMLKDKSKLQSSVEDMKAALADLSKRKAEADARLAEFKGLLNRFKSLIDAGKLQVKIVDGPHGGGVGLRRALRLRPVQACQDGEAAIAEVATSSRRSRPQVPGRGPTDNVRPSPR